MYEDSSLVGDVIESRESAREALAGLTLQQLMGPELFKAFSDLDLPD